MTTAMDAFHCFCGETKFNPGPTYISKWGPVPLVRCAACRTYRTSAVPSASDLVWLYESDDIYHPCSEEVFRARARDFEAVLADLRGLGLERRDLLEVGCNAGYALSAFLESGWSVTGIETNESTADYARKRLGVRIVSRIDSLPQTETFDVALLSHVLEHIPDPSSFLRALASRLRRGGLVCVLVPNYGSLLVRHVLKGAWCGFIPLQHVWYFDSLSLAGLMRKCGFFPVMVKSRHYLDWRSRTLWRTAIKIPLAGVHRLFPKDGTELLGIFRVE